MRKLMTTVAAAGIVTFPARCVLRKRRGSEAGRCKPLISTDMAVPLARHRERTGHQRHSAFAICGAGGKRAHCA
jgi:hypothetical protein